MPIPTDQDFALGEIDNLSNINSGQTVTVQEGKGVIANRAYSRTPEVRQ